LAKVIVKNKMSRFYGSLCMSQNPMYLILYTLYTVFTICTQFVDASHISQCHVG